MNKRSFASSKKKILLLSFSAITTNTYLYSYIAAYSKLI